MPRRLLRFLPFLLPPAAGVFCFLVSGQRPAMESLAAPTMPPLLAPALGPADLAVLDKLKRLEARLEAAADVPALVAVWTEAQGGFREDLIKNRLGRKIYHRMLDLSPEAAWAWVRSFPENAAPHPLVEFLNVWGGRDPAAAAAAVMALPGDHWMEIYQVAQGWAKADPAGFLKNGTPENWKMNQAQRQVFEKTALSSLAETDLPQALALAPKFCTDDSYAARDVFRRLAGRMMEERGVEGALAWARQLKDYSDTPRQKLLAEILPELAREDPRRAARELSGVLSHQTQEASSLIAGQWAAKEPDAALKWALSLPANEFGSNANGEAALAAVGEAIGPDAAGLLRAAGGITTSDPGMSGRALVFKLFPLIQGTGVTDPAKLAAGLASAPGSGPQSALLAAGMLQWSRTDALAAFKNLGTLPAESAALAREVMAENFGPSGVAGYSPEQTARFLRMVNEDPALAGVRNSWGYSKVWDKIASDDPQMALGLLEKNAETGTENSGVDAKAWSAVYASLAARDPQAAAAQALTVPEDRRGSAVGGLVGAWVEFDPMAASVWAGALPEGAGREAAAASLAQALTSVEPSSAFEWALSVKNDDQRQTLLGKSLQSWIKADAAGARQALETAPLSEGSREHFLKLFDGTAK